MAEVKRASAQSSSNAKKAKGSNGFWVNLGIVVLMIAIAHILFYGVVGSADNFLDEEKTSPANWMGNLYQGGFVIPLLMSMLLILIAFVIERAIVIIKAKGKTNGAEFVRKVQYYLANKNVDAAIKECDVQSGSVGNVMKAGLLKYKEMINNTELTTDQKVLSINKEIEEAAALEIPMLEKNLVFLSTITSASTLLGLIGTVLGMIRAFAGMAQAGAPDATALALGISEALYNTALGISGSFLAMIFYNLYTTIIDGVTYSIDESGFTLTQSFAANYN